MRDQLSQAYKKRLFIILSLFFISMTIALTVAQSAKQQNLRSSASVTYVNCTVGEGLLAEDNEEHDLTARINDYRIQNNLPSLTTHPELIRAAAWKARDMTQTGKLEHVDSVGRGPEDRIGQCHFAPLLYHGENIAKGQTKGQEVFNAWKNSPEHNKIMLCQECKYMGVARDRQNAGDWYWTVDVGTMKDEDVPTNSPPKTGPSSPPTNAPTRPPEVTLPPAKTELPQGTTGVLASIYIPGIGEYGNPNPRHPNRPLTVKVLDKNNKELAKADGIVSYVPDEEIFYGAIELPTSLETGTYLIKVKTDMSLTRTAFSGFLTIEKGKAIELPLVTLPTVDLDDNNAITVADVNVFSKCLREKNCERLKTDLDDDGNEDIFDYFVFGEVFGYYEGE